MGQSICIPASIPHSISLFCLYYVGLKNEVALVKDQPLRNTIRVTHERLTRVSWRVIRATSKFHKVHLRERVQHLYEYSHALPTTEYTCVAARPANERDNMAWRDARTTSAHARVHPHARHPSARGAFGSLDGPWLHRSNNFWSVELSGLSRVLA
jgi:hypothetical protein